MFAYCVLHASHGEVKGILFKVEVLHAFKKSRGLVRAWKVRLLWLLARLTRHIPCRFGENGGRPGMHSSSSCPSLCVLAHAPTLHALAKTGGACN